MSALIFPSPEPTADVIRDEVRRHYARAATEGNCCGDRSSATEAGTLGYSAEEIAALPPGADLGLGCGNPQAIAALKPGEVVLDLGSGAGFDCFLAARAVGPTGRAIGVDMTAEMLSRAWANAARSGVMNVDFRHGHIESLPAADATVDVIISNCVINLSPDKPAVFREAFRVLKPGGRLAVADIVRTADLPPEIARDLGALCGCVAGAARVDEVEAMLAAAGFVDIRIQPKDASRDFIRRWVPGSNAGDYVVSSTMEAVKPGAVIATAACCPPSCCA